MEYHLKNASALQNRGNMDNSFEKRVFPKLIQVLEVNA